MKRSREYAVRSAAKLAVTLVVGATMMLLIGVAPARAQVAGPTPPPDIECPAGTNKYVTPREVNVERGGLVLPPTLKVSRPLYVTGLVLPPGRLHIDKYVSWDGYLTRASSPVQPQERWAIRVGGVSTGLTDDLTDGVIEDTKTGSLGFIDQPGGVVEYVHSSLYLGVPPFDTDSVHPSGFCWTLDQPFDLTLTKSVVPSSVVSGGSVTYTVVVTNDGPGTAGAGWTMTDLLPAGTTAVSSTGTGVVCVNGVSTVGASTIVCTGSGPLLPRGSVSITVVATVTGAGPTLKNVAFVAPNPSDPPETNPLGTPPTLGTPTQTTPTNNDGEAIVTLSPAPPSSTTTTSTSTTTTVPSPTSSSAPTTIGVPTTSTTTTLPSGGTTPTPPAFAVATTSTTSTTVVLVAPPSSPAPGPGAPTLPASPTTSRAQGVPDVAPSSAPAVQVLGTEIINSTTGALAVTGSNDVRNSVLAVSLISVGVALVSIKRLRRR